MADDDLLRDDAKCRAAFRAGDRWALDAVYRGYLGVVYAVASRGFGGFGGFGDPVDRDEAAQATFALAFEETNRLRYDGLHPYSAFLGGLARNVIRQMLQRRQRFSNVPELPAVEARTLEETVIDQEVAEVVRRFPDTLTRVHEREVYQRYFCQGCAEERLAKELGISRYRLRQLIRRVHDRACKYLESHGITHG